jgi:ferredoxin-NADP reductase/MOSC domain-containing protein YiiM/ferredoxin
MAVVVSVNVGMPRDVAWQGKTVRTAIWKAPVVDRVFAHRLNLVGDGQGDLGGHGGEQRALMVYQLDSYRHWADFLNRSDLVHGIFGENLTIEGLPDSEVCIGDRFRIGGAVFEITQPRVTCYRVGMRLNQPEMPALLVAHHRPGFYFRVIEEGEVGAGDTIEQVAEGPERITVAEMDALLYTGKHPIEGLRRALRVPALSPGWQWSMRALLDEAEQGGWSGNAGLAPPASPPTAWRGFRPLEVIAVTQESADVKSFELASPDRSRLPDALPGQHLVFRLQPGADEAPVTRIFSLCGHPGTGTYRVAVKRESGAGSRFMDDRVRVGDVLEVSAPRGTFTLAPGTTPVVLLSAGIGVTPVLSMLYAIANAPDAAGRDVWWIHSARDGAHHAFGEEARRAIATMQHGHGCRIYSQPAAGDAVGTNYDIKGRLTLSTLEEIGVPQDADFYLCGPGRYLDDLQAALKTWGVAAGEIHAEIFGLMPAMMPGVVAAAQQAPHVPIELVKAGELSKSGSGQDAAPMVTFARSGIAVAWDRRFANILELAEACSVPVRWSCRAGVCHTCESGIIDGQVKYAPEPLDRPPDGTVLICCSSPASNVEMDL